MTVIPDNILEIVVQGVGVTYPLPVEISIDDSRLVIIPFADTVGHIICCQAVEPVVDLAVGLETAFYLEVEVVDDMPGDSRVGVPALAYPHIVIVPYGLYRRCIVSVVLFHIGTCRRHIQRDRGILHCVLQTAVASSGTAVIHRIGARPHYLRIRITYIEVECKLPDRFITGLEAEVVPVVVRPEHYGLVIDVRIAGCPGDLVGTSGDREVVAESLSGATEHLVDPVVALYILIQIHIGERAEDGRVVLVNHIPQRGQLVL